MHLETGLSRLAELNEVELKNMLQQADAEIERYKVVIRNYSDELMAKYGTPFMNTLLDNRNQVVMQLEKRKSQAEEKQC